MVKRQKNKFTSRSHSLTKKKLEKETFFFLPKMPPKSDLKKEINQSEIIAMALGD